MNIKRNIIFSLESRKRNGVQIIENVPIRMRVTYARNRIEFSAGYRIDVSKWDTDKQRVKNGCSNKLKQGSADINSDLNKYYSTIQDIFKEYEVENIIPEPEQIKNDFLFKCGFDKKDQELCKAFFLVFDEFVKTESIQNNWTESTLKAFKVVRNHLNVFDENISFKLLNDEKLMSYVNYLHGKELKNVYINKQISNFFWFLRWATKQGYNKNVSFETFKPKLKTTQKRIIFLTWEELTQLQEYKIPEEKRYLERVLDVFLFTCFTGLRYSDVYNLKRSDIKDYYIEVTTVKTADSLIIELNNRSRSILDKYKDFHFKNDKALPVISNQKMNNYLKELAEMAEINEPVRETYYRGNQRIDDVTPKYALLGTHAGRRTFICNALSLGIPAQVVMKWTGHSDYKAMKPYIDTADSVKVEAMKLFDNNIV